MPPSGGFFISGEFKGFEEAGPTAGGVKKCPVDTFLGRGRIHGQVTHPVGMTAPAHSSYLWAAEGVGPYRTKTGGSIALPFLLIT